MIYGLIGSTRETRANRTARFVNDDMIIILNDVENSSRLLTFFFLFTKISHQIVIIRLSLNHNSSADRRRCTPIRNTIIIVNYVHNSLHWIIIIKQYIDSIFVYVQWGLQIKMYTIYFFVSSRHGEIHKLLAARYLRRIMISQHSVEFPTAINAHYALTDAYNILCTREIIIYNIL